MTTLCPRQCNHRWRSIVGRSITTSWTCPERSKPESQERALLQDAERRRACNLFMSLIHTCELDKANPFDYFTELQKHFEELKQKPSEWMPWNYREALPRLATPAAA